MLVGKQEVKLLEIRPVSFHGQRFFDLVYSPADNLEQTLAGRAPYEDVYPDPRPGENAMLHFLMGAIVKVERSGKP